jgi:hypothetical protein
LESTYAIRRLPEKGVIDGYLLVASGKKVRGWQRLPLSVTVPSGRLECDANGEPSRKYSSLAHEARPFDSAQESVRSPTNGQIAAALDARAAASPDSGRSQPNALSVTFSPPATVSLRPQTPVG